jgi:sugar lactone lactonase YvrE
VWRIPRGTGAAGPAELWARHDLLAGDGSFAFLFRVGANGIAFRHNRILAANTERGLLVEIPVEPDGSAGTPAVLAARPALVGVDGIALDVHGRVYAATGVQHTIVRVERDGSTTTLATVEDGLDQPSTLAFGQSRGEQKTLFVANFSFFSGCCPAVLKLPVGGPWQPLP